MDAFTETSRAQHGRCLRKKTQMSLRPIKAGLLATAVLTAVLAPTGVASAGTITVDDGTGDVWEDIYNQETQTQEYAEAGSQFNVDVVSTVVRHTQYKVIIETSYADLKKQQVTFGTFNRLRFADGPRIVAAVDTFNAWRGASLLAKDGSGEPIKCGNLTHEIDYEANTVVLNIPRTCLGNPGWVEVNSFTAGNEEDPEASAGYRNYLDNALRAGPNDGGWTARVRKG